MACAPNRAPNVRQTHCITLFHVAHFVVLCAISRQEIAGCLAFGGLLQLFQGGYRGFESRWGHHLKSEARYQFGDGLFLPQRRDSNPTGCESRQIGGKTDSKASFSNKKPGPARCGPRLNTVTICQLHSTRRTGCRRRSGPASSRRPRSPPWHPRRHAAYP